METTLIRPNCSVVDFEKSKVWLNIKSQTNCLRSLQNEEGSVMEEVKKQKATEAVLFLISLLHSAKSWLPYQQPYLDALINDFKRWVEMGFGKPDFSESLKAFTPQKHREEGVLYFALFPMFTLNGSKSTKYDAVVFTIVWPAWLAKINQFYTHNDKFVSANLIDFTEGYHSECATLFPETVSVAGKAENEFGIIFSNREAERCVKFAKAAHDIWHINMDDNTKSLLNSSQLMQETYGLWDLLHDRSHFEGPLPFHIYMVRQRNPYFMYALEELRVDVASYVKAIRLFSEGYASAKYVPYSVIFDRVLRFSVIDGREKNLEALAGQVIFGALHTSGGIEINHGTLIFDWERMHRSMMKLHSEIENLYRNGQNLPKLEHWFACYEFINRYVKGNRASVWSNENRFKNLSNTAIEWIEATLNDEFPLNLFFVSHQKQLKNLKLMK